MMKKLLSTIMAMLLLWSFAVSAHAENEFVLRNGIQFGDTKEQVRAKETIAIDEKKSKEDSLWTEEGDVAGFEGVTILYRFDDEDKLIEVKWTMPHRTSSDTSNSDYEKLENAFQQKYGTPLGYSNGEWYIITTKAFENAVLVVTLVPSVDESGAISHYSEWDYEYQKGQHVKIELVQYYIKNNNIGGAIYMFEVGYKYFTDEELNAAKQEKEEKNAAVLNDI